MQVPFAFVLLPNSEGQEEASCACCSIASATTSTRAATKAQAGWLLLWLQVCSSWQVHRLQQKVWGLETFDEKPVLVQVQAFGPSKRQEVLQQDTWHS